jgi:hypothetical protein
MTARNQRSEAVDDWLADLPKNSIARTTDNEDRDDAESYNAVDYV